MKLQINGKVVESEAATVDQLITERALPPGRVVVEWNGSVLKRENWPATRLSAGDCLEILRFVGGG